jgi:hypothetical protein
MCKGFEVGKTRVRVYSLLAHEEIRQIAHYDRVQAGRIMKQLMKENDSIKNKGNRRWTCYEYSP